MTKVEVFNRENVVTIKNELETAMNLVCAKYGLNNVSLGNIKFTEKTFRTSTLSFGLTNSIKVDENLTDLIGRRFKLRRRIFTIKGVTNENHISVTTQNGTGYRVSLNQLKEMVEV